MRAFTVISSLTRTRFFLVTGRNLIHGSDSVESAEKEIALWFKKDEIVEWTVSSESAGRVDHSCRLPPPIDVVHVSHTHTAAFSRAATPTSTSRRASKLLTSARRS